MGKGSGRRDTGGPEDEPHLVAEADHVAGALDTVHDERTAGCRERRVRQPEPEGLVVRGVRVPAPRRHVDEVALAPCGRVGELERARRRLDRRVVERDVAEGADRLDGHPGRDPDRLADVPAPEHGTTRRGDAGLRALRRHRVGDAVDDRARRLPGGAAHLRDHHVRRHAGVRPGVGGRVDHAHHVGARVGGAGVGGDRRGAHARRAELPGSAAHAASPAVDHARAEVGLAARAGGPVALAEAAVAGRHTGARPAGDGGVEAADRAQDAAVAAVRRIGGDVGTDPEADAPRRAAGRHAPSRVARLPAGAGPPARAAVVAVAVEVDLAAVGSRPVAVAEARGTDQAAARPVRARRRAVRPRGAPVAARTAVQHVTRDVHLAAVRGVAVTVGEVEVAAPHPAAPGVARRGRVRGCHTLVAAAPAVRDRRRLVHAGPAAHRPAQRAEARAAPEGAHGTPRAGVAAHAAVAVVRSRVDAQPRAAGHPRGAHVPHRAAVPHVAHEVDLAAVGGVAVDVCEARVAADAAGTGDAGRATVHHGGRAGIPHRAAVPHVAHEVDLAAVAHVAVDVGEAGHAGVHADARRARGHGVGARRAGVVAAAAVRDRARHVHAGARALGHPGGAVTLAAARAATVARAAVVPAEATVHAAGLQVGAPAHAARLAERARRGAHVGRDDDVRGGRASVRDRPRHAQASEHGRAGRTARLGRRVGAQMGARLVRDARRPAVGRGHHLDVRHGHHPCVGDDGDAGPLPGARVREALLARPAARGAARLARPVDAGERATARDRAGAARVDRGRHARVRHQDRGDAHAAAAHVAGAADVVAPTAVGAVGRGVDTRGAAHHAGRRAGRGRVGQRGEHVDRDGRLYRRIGGVGVVGARILVAEVSVPAAHRDKREGGKSASTDQTCGRSHCRTSLEMARSDAPSRR